LEILNDLQLIFLYLLVIYDLTKINIYYMKKSENKPKKVYQKPNIDKIRLDNEISMVMMSWGGGPPPVDPEPEIKLLKLFKL